MHIDISHLLVDEHRRRLREAAQAPTNQLAVRVWAAARRRREPPPPRAWVPARELERLAA
jgi:hypothetical protein